MTLLRRFSTTTARQISLPRSAYTRPATPKPRLSPDALNRSLSLINSCSHLPRLLLPLHAHLLRSHLFLFHDLSLSFFSASSSQPIPYLHRLFSLFRRPRLAHYNVLLRALSSATNTHSHHWPRCFTAMLRNGVVPSSDTLLFSSKCCANSRSLLGGLQLHSRALNSGFQSDSFLMTALMEMYSSCGECSDALKVFDEIPHRDVVAWNAVISCFISNSRTRDALVLFNAMQSFNGGCRPDYVTCLLMLHACGTLGAIDSGRTVRAFIDDRGYWGVTKLGNALISMYSKCGCLEEAFDVFTRMSRRNVVSWTAVVHGLAINGYGQRAIEVFREMLCVPIAPDAHAFTAVLLACSRSGLVDEGIRFFDQMKEEFGAIPNIHHYGCMVELLGRAGLLDQAYDLIMSMTIEPDVMIWRTLLAACRIYRNVSLGEVVVDRLVEVKAQQAGDFVLLLNMYTSVGNWEKVNELSKYMEDNGMHSTPGCTTIELKGMLYEFVADDTSHPRKDEIYGMLHEIEQQLRIAGYVPDISSELHKMGTEKTGNLPSNYHSEKLAIAFAVLVTPPGTTIRVAKNLHICMDCHNFAKVLSAAYNRKVIIRDHMRIHHFRQGSCSCND